MATGVYIRTKAPWNKGIPRTQEDKDKISEANKGRVSWCKGKKRPELNGNTNGFKKGQTPWNKDVTGIKQTREYKVKWRKEHRHKMGISKKYMSELGISKTKEYRKLYQQRWKAFSKGGGEITTKTIQLVYEDNIKKYGTLTCIYCTNPIEFGKDTLEHKQPLSKGGTNEYYNLGIACRSCNSSKGNKTEYEFRKEKKIP